MASAYSIPKWIQLPLQFILVSQLLIIVANQMRLPPLKVLRCIYMQSKISNVWIGPRLNKLNGFFKMNLVFKLSIYALFLQIFISYIDLLNTPAQRRAELQANYYFFCICAKCTNTEETHEMLAAACANKNCNELLDINLNNCPRCDAGVSPKHRNAYNEAMTITKTHLENMKDIACG